MISALLAVWVGLNVVDLAETLYALSIGHVERNPLAAAFYDQAGPAGLVALKLILVGVVLGLAYVRPGRAMTVLLAAAVALMLFVVIHNAEVLGQ